MGEVIKIAFQNFKRNRKKTIYVGIAVYISLMMLLMSNAFVNGMQKQITNAYINIQSGDVPVMWKDHYESSALLPGKFVNPNTTKTFEVDEDKDNKEAINVLDEYLEDHEDEVDFVAKIVRRAAKFVVEDESYSALIYGLEEDDREQMEKTKTFVLETGDWPKEDDEMVISRQRADTCDLEIGDEVSIDTFDVKNHKIVKKYKISGIYKNGAEYNNFYMVITPNSARKLLGMDDEMFDLVKVFLKDSDKASDFATDLDKTLLDESEVLRAEDYYDAGLFFTALSPTLKIIYRCFVVLLLLVISMGLRSVIRLNIYSSMKEFGTMRAIGFSKAKCFFIVFFELLLVCLVALGLALCVVLGFVFAFSETGMYIGTNVMTNAFGGEYLYFILRPMDYIFSIIVMIFFVVISTSAPALKMCNTKIADMLNRPKMDI